MNDLISVVVPVFNIERQLLDKCIESIVNQTHRNLEIIIIDDGSRQECAYECDRLARTDSRIIVKHQRNTGVSGARNAGLDIARGDYLGFVDPDDYVDEDMYKSMLTQIEKDGSDICVCGFNLTYKNGDLKEREFYSHSQVFSSEDAYRELMIDKEINSCVWNKLYKRSLFDNISFPLGTCFEDCYIMHEIFHRCRKVSAINGYYYNYYQRTGSIMNDIDVDKFVQRIDSFVARLRFTERFYPQYVNLVYESIIKVSIKYLINPAKHLKNSRSEYVQKTLRIFEFLESDGVKTVVKKMPKYYDAYVFLMKHRYSFCFKGLRWIFKGLTLV